MPVAGYNEQMSQDQGKTIGKGMIITAWLIVLAMLTLYFSHLLEEQHNPNQELQGRVLDSGVREVKLLRNRAGHYVSPGEINGHKVVFLLDTGATRVSIPEKTATRIGLKRGFPLNVSTANGTIQVYNTRLDELRLGDIVLYDVQASINPYMDDDSILLGMNVLKRLELVQREDTLTLRQYP